MTPWDNCRLYPDTTCEIVLDDPTQADRDRPLNERGRRSARELGDWLASRGYEPGERCCARPRCARARPGNRRRRRAV